MQVLGLMQASVLSHIRASREHLCIDAQMPAHMHICAHMCARALITQRMHSCTQKYTPTFALVRTHRCTHARLHACAGICATFSFTHANTHPYTARNHVDTHILTSTSTGCIVSMHTRTMHASVLSYIRASREHLCTYAQIRTHACTHVRTCAYALHARENTCTPSHLHRRAHEHMRYILIHAHSFAPLRVCTQVMFFS